MNDETTDIASEVIDKDEVLLNQFLELLEESGIEITTGFLPDDNGIFTHQVLKITCGEYVTVSQPEALHLPLMPVGAPEGATLN